MKYKKHFIGNTIPQEEGLSDNNITEDIYTSTKAEDSDNYIVAGDPFVKKFTTMSGDVRDTSTKTRMTEEDNIGVRLQPWCLLLDFQYFLLLYVLCFYQWEHR
jgi:hypothetical protein